MPSCFVWTQGKQFSGGQTLLQRSYTWRSLGLPATLDISQGVVGEEGGDGDGRLEWSDQTVSWHVGQWRMRLCSERVF